MPSNSEDFDKKISELKSQVSFLQKQIEETEKAKKDYTSNALRADFLLRNSVVLNDARLEVYDGNYFIVGQDDAFTYAMRLTKNQAEYLADDLDAQLGKAHIDSLFQKNIVSNMVDPYIKKITKK